MVNEDRYPVDSYSWRIPSSTVALKMMDRSAFLHHGTGIPTEIRSFFGIAELGKGLRRAITIMHNDRAYKASIDMDNQEVPRSRLFWHKDFEKIIGNRFPEIFKCFIDEIELQTEIIPEMKFTKRKDDEYLVEFLRSNEEGDLVNELVRVLDYLPVRKQQKSDHRAYETLINNTIPSIIRQIIPQDCYDIAGRIGMGQKADVPWIGIHDKRIDSGAQTGVYLTILFNVIGDGFAISLQHGATKISSLKKIRQRTHELSSQIVSPSKDFTKEPITLRPPEGHEIVLGNSSNPAKYEIASIIAKQYTRESIAEKMKDDLLRMLQVYKGWVSDITNEDDEKEYQKQPGKVIANVSPQPQERSDKLQQRAGSKSPPRDKNIGETALSNARYLCELDTGHNTFITPQGNQFMEKHHLIPMEYYEEYKLSVDHTVNIYSLCPNCHSAIHYANKKDKKKIVTDLYKAREDLYLQYYEANLAKVLKHYKL